MNMYACASPSHMKLARHHFLPSIPLDLNLVELAQLEQPLLDSKTNERSTGTYGQIGFNRACELKIRHLLTCLRRQGSPFVYSDVDIRFYGCVAEEALSALGDRDIAFQHDGPVGPCTGFMVIRPSFQIVTLFERVLTAMLNDDIHDQEALVRVIGGTNCRWTFLPSEKFWTFGQTGCLWEPGQDVNVPNALLMHHANWTIGLEHKDALLELVYAKTELARKAAS